jgi:hypothetical protein
MYDEVRRSLASCTRFVVVWLRVRGPSQFVFVYEIRRFVQEPPNAAFGHQARAKLPFGPKNVSCSPSKVGVHVWGLSIQREQV